MPGLARFPALPEARIQDASHKEGEVWYEYLRFAFCFPMGRYFCFLIG